MKTFHTDEAKILDLITNNLEMFVGPPKKAGHRQIYYFSIAAETYEQTREHLRTILTSIYREGLADGERGVKWA